MQQLQQIWGQKDLHLHHIARTWQALKLGLGGNLERNFPDLQCIQEEEKGESKRTTKLRLSLRREGCDAKGEEAPNFSRQNSRSSKKGLDFML